MKWLTAVVASLLAVAVLGACGSEQHPNSSRTDTQQADHNAQDSAFARNMISHHEQAVEMAQMVATQTQNQRMVDLATQLIVAQLQEVQALRAWLMARADSQQHDPGGDGGTPMPGMVDKATMDRLRTLTGAEFDRLWLTSMIDHQRGAIAMAQDEVAHGKNPDVIYLAKSTIDAQQAEIDRMKQMLGG